MIRIITGRRPLLMEVYVLRYESFPTKQGMILFAPSIHKICGEIYVSVYHIGGGIGITLCFIPTSFPPAALHVLFWKGLGGLRQIWKKMINDISVNRS